LRWQEGLLLLLLVLLLVLLLLLLRGGRLAGPWHLLAVGVAKNGAN
jgi:hypothetical protein